MQHSIHMDQLKMTQSRLKQEKDLLQSKLQSANSQLENQMQENTSLRSTISTQSANCLALESDNRALKEKVQVYSLATIRSHSMNIMDRVYPLHANYFLLLDYV